MHIAELITFSKVGDLPPRLRPFVEIKGVFENREVKEDTKVIVFKIKGTLDSHHVIFVDDNPTVEKIEAKLHKDLDGVTLSPFTIEKLQKMLNDRSILHLQRGKGG